MISLVSSNTSCVRFGNIRSLSFFLHQTILLRNVLLTFVSIPLSLPDGNLPLFLPSKFPFPVFGKESDYSDQAIFQPLPGRCLMLHPKYEKGCKVKYLSGSLIVNSSSNMIIWRSALLYTGLFSSISTSSLI